MHPARQDRRDVGEMSNQWTRYHGIPTSWPRPAPTRKAPEEAHVAAEKAWADSYRYHYGLPPTGSVMAPILGPAVDAAYVLGRQQAAEAIRQWIEDNRPYPWVQVDSSLLTEDRLYRIALGE